MLVTQTLTSLSGGNAAPRDAFGSSTRF